MNKLEATASKEGRRKVGRPRKEPGKADLKKIRKYTKNQLRTRIKRQLQGQNTANTRQNKTITYKYLDICLGLQELTCSICLELMLHPVNLECGHSFCLRCIENLNKTEMKYKCALCRAIDYKEFYEIDGLVEKLILQTEQNRLSESEKAEYRCKKETTKKEFALRGIKRRLRVNDEIKVRLNQLWEKARVLELKECGGKVYYVLQRSGEERKYLIPQNSLNLALNQEESTRLKRDTRCIFSENIFVEENNPRPLIPNTYNIEELLWEINYYTPSTRPVSPWVFEPNMIDYAESEHLQESVGESVQYLGRNIPGIIEID